MFIYRMDIKGYKVPPNTLGIKLSLNARNTLIHNLFPSVFQMSAFLLYP